MAMNHPQNVMTLKCAVNLIMVYIHDVHGQVALVFGAGIACLQGNLQAFLRGPGQEVLLPGRVPNHTF